MCGIAGIFYFKSKPKGSFIQHNTVLSALRHRGPDFQKHISYPLAELYHSRLSILDLSEASHQPFEDSGKKHALVYNGEIFNYQELSKKNTSISTHGDVEVLFQRLKREKENSLNQLNGFFALGFLDIEQHELLLVRDRLGIKPLYYFVDNEKLVFASELKALLHITGPLEINKEQLYTYFRVNYCAGSERIFKGVFALAPGSYLKADASGITLKTWYRPANQSVSLNLESLLTDAVDIRLQADVPVGCFLSGGLDSSIVSALAKKHKSDLKTFSIGFKDHRFLDESRYAEKMAEHIKSNHFSYRLKEDDFLQHLPEFFKSIDEPFADSSAFNFYLLSKYCREEIKVALSGDGADELFKGYLKHKALHFSRHPLVRASAAILAPMLGNFPASRENVSQNRIRQLRKIRQLNNLSTIEKQKFLASISTHNESKSLIKGVITGEPFDQLFMNAGIFSDFLMDDWFDLQVVLTEDMLVKVDRFSMRHGLEIRNPFLDYRIVEYALKLPKNQKINFLQQKIILKKQLAHLLPEDILQRSKKGFELPLRSWLCGQLKGQVENNWLNEEKIINEGYLNYESVSQLKTKMFSKNPGDSAAKVWALIVFEHWLNNYKEFIKPNA